MSSTYRKHIGFTGTSQGMTDAHKEAVRRILVQERTDTSLQLALHHGDCVGADGETSRIADGIGGIWIVVHPSDKPSKRAWSRFDECRESKPPLERNRDIVAASRILIAAPRGFDEELRSGTWATVRYAWKLQMLVVFAYRNGSILYDGSDHTGKLQYHNEEQLAL